MMVARKGARGMRRWDGATSYGDRGYFRVQVGPFFDTGAIADPSGLFGSQKWLFDTGVQAKVRVLGSVSVVLSYGKDLRNGKGLFYATTAR